MELAGNWNCGLMMGVFHKKYDSKFPFLLDIIYGSSHATFWLLNQQVTSNLSKISKIEIYFIAQFITKHKTKLFKLECKHET
jgi:hypothetical protein